MNRKYNNIDDLFRDKFEDFEVDPPEYVWEQVKAGIGKAEGNGRGSGLTRGGIAGLTIFVIAIGIATLFFINDSFVSSKEVTGVKPESTSAATGLLADNAPEPSNSRTEAEPVMVSPGNEGSWNDDGKKEKKSQVRGNNPKKNSSVMINPSTTGPVKEERLAVRPVTVAPVKPSPFITRRAADNQAMIQEKPVPARDANPAAVTLTEGTVSSSVSNDMLRNSPNEPADMPSGRDNSRLQGRWNLGLYFTPEMITYASDDQLKNYSYSIDLHASRKFGNYFLQSGLGVSRNHDQGNSLIDYNKYLGSYEDVYDVTFDSTANGIVPVYHTETVHVYDSVSHVVVSPTKRYFTYLQVPLFIGYGEESRRFGWFFKVGPSLSFLIHEDVPQSGLGDSQARIISIENELPGRIQTHWQFIASAGVTYKLGTRMSLSMEPMFRYYIKSAYEPDKLNTRHPFSVGLRTGLLLNF